MEEHCPITFIDVIYDPQPEIVDEPITSNVTNTGPNITTEVSNSTESVQVDEITENDTATESDRSLLYSENLRFVFDKHTDNLPITRTLIDSGLPCLTSPGFNIPDENFSKIDIELDMYNECTS